MIGFLKALVASDDKAADSIVVGGLFAMVTLCALMAYDTVIVHNAFSPLNFGAAAAAILGGIGGGKLARDGRGKDDDVPKS